MKIPYESIIIYCSIGSGTVIAGLQYLKERKLEKRLYKACERNKEIFEKILKDDKFFDGLAKKLMQKNSQNSSKT